MAKQNRSTLKGYFETCDVPSQAQYADLIDSNFNLSEADSILVTNITASGNISSSGNVYAMNTVAITGASNGQTLTQKAGVNDFVMIENGHKTASGNISSSGTITATGYK